MHWVLVIFATMSYYPHIGSGGTEIEVNQSSNITSAITSAIIEYDTKEECGNSLNKNFNLIEIESKGKNFYMECYKSR